MSMKGCALAAALCGAVLCGTSAQAAVRIYDLGTVAVDDSTLYGGTTTSGNFTVYEKFSFGAAPVQASVSYSNTVRVASQAITGGVLSLFSCLTNCTGSTLAPTGTLLASVNLTNITSFVQMASLSQITLPTAGSYFLQLTGRTTAPGNGVTFAGTVSLDTVGGVPEPSTWAMMLLGFAGLAFAYGRSNRAATIA